MICAEFFVTWREQNWSNTMLSSAYAVQLYEDLQAEEDQLPGS